MTETCWSVYVHTDPNGKRYVGTTRQKPVYRRWKRNGEGYAHSKRFYDAIKKYGWENFSHEIVQTGMPFEQACQLERELIAKYRTCEEEFGYNCETGGIKGIQSVTMAHKRGKHVYQYDLDGTYLRSFRSSSEAERHVFNKCNQKVSFACKSESHYCGGYLWSAEKVERMQPYKRRDWKAILQFDLNGNLVNRFNSLTEACRVVIGKNVAVNLCDNKTAYGYIWKYEGETI